MIARHTFRAMGTDIELLLDGAPAGYFHAVEAEFERLEALLSRFRPDSELSRLNAAGELDAGPDLLAVTRAAVAARERSQGRFDPTVYDALVAAGYDRSFELVAHDIPDRQGPPSSCGGSVDVDGSHITLGRDVRLDLGGIAKGYTVDRAASILADAGPCLVNAGGDLAARGGRWPVGLEGTDLVLELADGAIATSGRNRRRWRRGNEERHHLIDPATGRPADTDLLHVTVVGSTALEADVLAKVAFLGGHVDAPRVLVLADGTVKLAGGLG
ncbi:MAG TPA: FAD:protein FMN transferase [Gaiellaceae bacterium]|jgi:thiamine biosynthesis lipoprotein|nr:FAD:protein FMN transferase [Gaiellaceae bacterium]